MYSLYSILLVYLCLCSSLCVGPTIADGPRRLRQIGHDPNKNKVFIDSTGKEGFITSPLYPSTSETQEERLYSFIGHSDERVQIIFNDFDLHKLSPNEKCGPKNSFLSYEKPWKQTVFICGPRPLQIVSEGSDIVLKYTVPENFQAKEEFRGFNASYKFITNFGVNSSERANIAGLCDFKYDSNMDAQSGSFNSPNFPGFYPRNTVCSFTFRGQEKFLKIEFTKFNLLGGSDKKSSYMTSLEQSENPQPGPWAQLRIHCESYKNDKIILRSWIKFGRQDASGGTPFRYLCGKHDHFSIIFKPSSDDVTIQLKLVPSFIRLNDSVFNEPELFVGFQANFEFTNDKFSFSRTLSSGFITSPLYLSKSDTQEDRLYIFLGSPDERVQIIFDDFDLYKLPPNEKCGPKNSFLSYEKPWKQTVFICGPRPLQILSEGSEFILEYAAPENFHAKEEFRGFNASYKFITNFGVNSGKQTHPGLCDFVYDNSVDAQSGTFNSPNFPGFYPRNTDCSFIFNGQEKFLKIEFTKFNLLGGSNENCISGEDDMMHLTGQINHNKDQKTFIGYRCGKHDPFSIIVRASSFPFTIRLVRTRKQFNNFVSNEPELFIGFQANFKFANDEASFFSTLSSEMNEPELCVETSFSSYQINEWLIEAESIIWVVGILGNLVNIVIFRHKNMTHPINLIFWWLSISDLLELALIASYQLYPGGCNAAQIFIFVVAHALKNRRSPLNDRSIKLVVICVYILSFILYLPFWYVHEIRVLRKGLPDYPLVVDIRGGEYSDLEPELIPGTQYLFRDPLANIYALVYGIVLRIGPLIILIILCTLLSLAMKKAHRNRQSLGMDAHQLSKSRRNINRMDVTVVMIITMFLMTEVPYAISTLLLLHKTSTDCSKIQHCTVLLPFVLLNCSYNIVCYLIRIGQYRKTLKFLLSKINLVNSKIYIVLFITIALILFVLYFVLRNMKTFI